MWQILQFVIPVFQTIGVIIVYFCAGYMVHMVKDMRRMREEIREMRIKAYDRDRLYAEEFIKAMEDHLFKAN